MLKTSDDILNDVVRKLGITTTTAFYTDTILNQWIKQGTRWATSYKKWPFTEGRVSTTYVAGTEEWSFEGYKADSFRIMTVGGKRLDKLNFDDYRIFREETPDSNDRVFSDFGRLVFINPNIDASGTLTAYGQLQHVDIDTTDNTATTPFSEWDEEGNEAIVEKVLSFARLREQKSREAQYHHERAKEILDSLYKTIGDEQFNYKTHSSRGGMFKYFDILRGGLRDDITNTDQFF